MQNIIENYWGEIATSTDLGGYTKGLLVSMRQTNDLATRKMLRDMLWGARPEGVNELIHGAKDAIREQT
jgi:hypothetical protein